MDEVIKLDELLNTESSTDQFFSILSLIENKINGLYDEKTKLSELQKIESENTEKIILYTVYVYSFDETISKHGARMLETLNMSDLESYDTHVQKFIYSTIILNTKNDKLRMPYYNILNDIQFLSISDKTENSLLESIKHAHKKGLTIEYSKLFSDHAQILPCHVAEIFVYLSSMERHPGVLVFNFMNALKNLEINYFENLVDNFFEYRSSLDYERLFTIVTQYQKIFKSPLNIIEILKYRNYENYAILYIELAVTTELVSLNNACAFENVNFISLFLFIYNKIPDKILRLLKLAINNAELILLGILHQKLRPKKILNELLIYCIKNDKIDTLKYAWSKKSLQPLILQTLQEYFTQNFSDKLSRLSRILDICIALDALTKLLMNSSIAFGIEIAFAAAKRNSYPLDLYLQNKLSTHAQQFLSAILVYLTKHYSPLFTEIARTEDYRVDLDFHKNLYVLDPCVSFLWENRELTAHEQRIKIQMLYNNYVFISRLDLKDEIRDDKIQDSAHVVSILLRHIISIENFEQKCMNIDDFFKQNIISTCEPAGHSFTLYYISKVLMYAHVYKILSDADLFSVVAILSRMITHEYLDSKILIQWIDEMFYEFPINSRYFFCAVSILSFVFVSLVTLPKICKKWFKSEFFGFLPPFVRYCVELIVHLGSFDDDSGVIPFNDPMYVLVKHKNFIPFMVTYNAQPPKSFYHELLYFYSYHTIIQDINTSRWEKLFNLTDQNLETIYTDYQNLDNDSYLSLAYFFVHKIISFRINDFSLFKIFYKKVDSKFFYSKLRLVTDSYIRKILSEYKYPENIELRRVLYNLSLWFGFITIGDNKSPHYTELNYKHLLIEANLKSQDDTLLILPCIRNYLHHARNKIIFKKQNFFIQQFFRVLVEIYQKYDTRDELKFEIDAIFRSFDANLKSFEPSKFSDYSEYLLKVKPLLFWTEKEIKLKSFKIDISFVDSLSYDRIKSFMSGCFAHKLYLENCPLSIKESVILAFEDMVTHIGQILLDKNSELIGKMVLGIVADDFRRDPSEHRLRYCSQVVGKSVCLSKSCVLLKNLYFQEFCKTLRDQLINLYTSRIDDFKQSEKEAIDSYVFDLIQNNIELIIATSLIACTEKILIYVESKLKKEMDSRKLFKEKPNDLMTGSIDLLAEKFKLKLNHIPTSSQLSVYHEFNKFSPGFIYTEKNIDMNVSENINISYFNTFSDHDKNLTLQILSNSYSRIQKHLINGKNRKNCESTNSLLLVLNYIIHSKNLSLIPIVIKHCLTNFLFYIKKMNEDVFYLHFVDIMIELLSLLEETIRHNFTLLLTHIFFDFPLNERLSSGPIILLISKKLLDLNEFDKRIKADFEKNNQQFIDFLIELCNSLFNDAKNYGIATDYQFCRILCILYDIVDHNDKYFDVDNTDIKTDIIEAEPLLQEVINLYFSNKQKNLLCFKFFVLKLGHSGFLENETSLLRFLKACFIIMLSPTNKSPSDQVSEVLNAYLIADPILQYLTLLIKFYGGNKLVNHPQKILFFSKILHIIQQLFDDSRHKNFQSHVFEKIFIGFVVEILRPDFPNLELNEKLIICLNGFLHCLRPEIQPSFTNSFLNIISDYNLWYICLKNGATQKPALTLSVLFCDFFRFLKYCELAEKYVNRITKIMSELVSAYPEFISFNYLVFLNNLPEKYYQIRNIILSAIPSSNIVSSPAHIETPQVFSATYHLPISLVKITDSYLKKRKPADFLKYCVSYFDYNYKSASDSLGFSIINSYVYYLGSRGSDEICSKNLVTVETVKSCMNYQILFNLAEMFKSRVLYMLLTSIVNHIRYPSTHTLFFTYSIQNIFTSTQKEDIKEKITRILFERLIIFGPYPTGLMLFLTKFLKEPIFNLKKLKFLQTPFGNSCIEKIQTHIKGQGIKM